MNLATISKYLPGVGLLGLAVYQASIGDLAHASSALLAALVAFGIRSPSPPGPAPAPASAKP